MSGDPPRLLDLGDLHVTCPENREFVAGLGSGPADDWLVIVGGVGEGMADIEWVFEVTRARFATFVWCPGNHDVWTHSIDTDPARGAERCARLVGMARRSGVHTLEDPYPVWTDGTTTATLVPVFLGYDYSFLPPGTSTSDEGLAAARDAGIVCADELFLHSDPYHTRAEWCAARLDDTRSRLDEILEDQDPVNHYPPERDPVDSLRHPEFAQWCGTEATRGCDRRYRVRAVVYAHLHVPRTLEIDGVPHHEVSVGYPREWRRWGGHMPPRQILPAER